MDKVTIEVREDGPYKITGPVQLFDHSGELVETPEDRAIFLCRCGHSVEKPFCDGTHKQVGWCATSEEGS